MTILIVALILQTPLWAFVLYRIKRPTPVKGFERVSAKDAREGFGLQVAPVRVNRGVRTQRASEFL